MNQLLLQVLRALDQENIVYCQLRGYDQLLQPTAQQDIDLLIDRLELKRLRDLLTGFDFTALPSWGHAPHHFFVAYDEESDRWIKFDVVTGIAYGRPGHALRTELARGCLLHRRRCDPTFVPSPEDELVTLLLHCILDKRDFGMEDRHRLKALCSQIGGTSYLSDLLAANWSPAMTWAQLHAELGEDRLEWLLAQREEVAAYLRLRDPLGTRYREARDDALRKLDRLTQCVRPRAVSVALLAPDGAGKTTLSARLQSSFLFPVRSIYMGSYQTQLGGPRSTTQPRPVHKRRLGQGLLRRLFLQWRRYLLARYFLARGRLVIFDRYPYEALLPPPHGASRLARWRRWLLGHACPGPDLVLLLDAPGQVLYARKGERNAKDLEKQRQQFLEWAPCLKQLVLVDASLDIDQVQRRVTSVIWRVYSRRLGGGGKK